jgi:AcrR family transcriptional regulator
MPRSLSPADVEAFRNRLCDVAEKMFAARGPDGVTMREMADELGVSSMTPYRYFKDKDAILAAVRTRAFNRFAAAMESVRLESAPQNAKARPGNAYLDFALAHPAAYRMMFDVSQPTFADHPELVAAMAAPGSPWGQGFASWPPPGVSKAM